MCQMSALSSPDSSDLVDPWPAAVAAKSTSFSLPSRPSVLACLVLTLLGRHSSTVSLACFSRDVIGLIGAIPARSSASVASFSLHCKEMLQDKRHWTQNNLKLTLLTSNPFSDTGLGESFLRHNSLGLPLCKRRYIVVVTRDAILKRSRTIVVLMSEA